MENESQLKGRDMSLLSNFNLDIILFGVISSLISKVIWERVSGKNLSYEMDTKSLKLLEIALKILPVKEREYYRDEWYMMLLDQPDAISRLKHALGIVRASITISTEVKVIAPVLIIMGTTRRSILSNFIQARTISLYRLNRFFNFSLILFKKIDEVFPNDNAPTVKKYYLRALRGVFYGISPVIIYILIPEFFDFIIEFFVLDGTI